MCKLVVMRGHHDDGRAGGASLYGAQPVKRGGQPASPLRHLPQHQVQGAPGEEVLVGRVVSERAFILSITHLLIVLNLICFHTHSPPLQVLLCQRCHETFRCTNTQTQPFMGSGNKYRQPVARNSHNVVVPPSGRPRQVLFSRRSN